MPSKDNKTIPHLNDFQIEEQSRAPIPFDLRRDGFTITKIDTSDQGRFDIMVSEENKNIKKIENLFVYKNISSEWFIGIPRVNDAKSFHFPSFYKYWDFIWRGQEAPKHVDTKKKIFGIAVFAGLSNDPIGEAGNDKIELMYKLSLFLPVYTNIKIKKKNLPEQSKIIHIDIKTDWNNIRDFRNSKHHFISQYTHNLCFEDSINEGYLTEQIFDSIVNGCVPIYKGDPHIEKWISKKYFINAQGKKAEEIVSEIETTKDLIETINKKKTGCIKIQLKDMRKMLKVFENKIVQSRAETYQKTEPSALPPDYKNRRVFFNVFSMREMMQNPLGCDLSKEGYTFTSIFLNTPGHFDIFYSGENRRYDTIPEIFTYENVSSEWFIGIPKINNPKAFHFPLFYMYWDFIEKGYEKPVHVDNKIFGVSFVSSHIAKGRNWAEKDLTNERFNLIHELSLFVPVFANSCLKDRSPKWSKVIYIDVPRHYDNNISRNYKHKFLSKFTHSLCFENSVADGYTTEKIFDPVANGCVPIYKGDPQIEKWISKDYFIDARDKTVIDIVTEIYNRKDLSKTLNAKKTDCFKIQLEDMKALLKRFEQRIRNSTN